MKTWCEQHASTETPLHGREVLLVQTSVCEPWPWIIPPLHFLGGSIVESQSSQPIVDDGRIDASVARQEQRFLCHLSYWCCQY
jgi:hypothetical protein